MTTLNPLAVQNAALLRELAVEGAAGESFREIARRVDREESNVRKTIKTLEAEGLVHKLMKALTPAGRAQLDAIDRAEGGADAVLPSGFLAVLHRQIRPDPDQARKDWDSEDARADLNGLAEDLYDRGDVLQNLNAHATDDTVRADDGTDLPVFQLIGGERRWRAIAILMSRPVDQRGWRPDRPVVIALRSGDELEIMLAGLSENMQRRNLNPIEEGRAFSKLRDAGLDTADLALRVKKTQRFVQKRIQLLDLTDEQQRRLTLPDDDPQRLSVSDAFKLVQNLEARRKLRDKAEAALAPRQRLIIAEMRLATGEGYFSERIQVDGDAMNLDEDAIALDKAGYLHIPTTVNEEGQALARFDWNAESMVGALLMDGAGDYAAAMRSELDLPSPDDEAWSTPWLNGPFDLTPELKARIEADKAAAAQQRAEHEAAWARAATAREARTGRMALMRVHAEAMLAKAAVAPLAPIVEDLPQIAGGLEHRLPWRATIMAEALDADGDRVTRFGNYYSEAADDAVALAMLTVVAVNTAAGLETPPLQNPPEPEQDIDGSDPDPDADRADEDEYETDPVEASINAFVEAELDDDEAAIPGDEPEIPPTVEGEAQTPAVPIRKSITPDHIVCLEDGRKFKSMKRHLRTKYDLSPEQYRAKWGLPADYPMVAPNYARARDELARQMGVGQPAPAESEPA